MEREVGTDTEQGTEEGTDMSSSPAPLPEDYTCIKSEPNTEADQDAMQTSMEIEPDHQETSCKSDVNKSLNKLVCNICFQLFASKGTLRNHIKSKHTPKDPNAFR